MYGTPNTDGIQSRQGQGVNGEPGCRDSGIRLSSGLESDKRGLWQTTIF